jgi:hypothetical protein
VLDVGLRKKLGIERIFCNMIKSIYEKPMTKITLNGDIVYIFLLRSKTRESYLLLPLSFNIKNF